MKRNSKGQYLNRTTGEVFEGFGVFYTKKGYPCVYINGKNILVHVFVWEKENGKKRKGLDLHHKDFDKSNYDINNLELLTKSDHLRIHAKWVRSKDGSWIKKPCKDCKNTLPLDAFYQRRGLTPSNRCIECSKIKWHRDAAEKGVIPKRSIKLNGKDVYECSICGVQNKKEGHRFSSGKPQSYCKKCYNKYQKKRRNEKKIINP